MRRCLPWLALLLACSMLPACAGPARSPYAQWEAFSTLYGALPTGQCYTSQAQAWEAGALPDGLADLLYQEASGENAFFLCDSYVIYLSSGHTGGEIAFLHCRNATDAHRVARMGEARIARVRRILPGAAICQGAGVLQEGCCVIIYLLPDNARARDICQKIL